VTRERLEHQPDGWNWADPRWRERICQTNVLALVFEASRRAVELRDALAESGSQDVTRALFLNDVINTLYQVADHQEASVSGVSLEPPSGTGVEMLDPLYEAGLLDASLYRSTVSCEHLVMYGDPVDIAMFLQRALVARVATNGPTLRPIWYLYEDPTFFWLTDTSNYLHRAALRGERLVLVVDVCEISTGEVIHVRAGGQAEIIAVDKPRAMRKFARYLGADESQWDPRFVRSLELPTTRMCRFTPASIEAADVSFLVRGSDSA
jgi:hypothetical protein